MYFVDMYIIGDEIFTIIYRLTKNALKIEAIKWC